MRNKVERTIPKGKNMSRNILTFHVQVNTRYRSQNMKIFNIPINLEKNVGNIFKLVTLFHYILTSTKQGQNIYSEK